MKHQILIIILCFPFLVFAEYNGVHSEFEILLNNGHKICGYKYIAHIGNTAEDKKYLEENPDILLINQFTYEPDQYGYYKRRLKYNLQKSSVYKLIEPVEIKIEEINSVIINELIIASYDIQIVGDYKWEDRHWLNSEPITRYSEGENMCSYDTYIHCLGDIPIEVIKQIKFIVQQINIKIKAREKEIEELINSDQEYQNKMKDLYNERSLLLKPYFEKYSNLKTVSISICTC